jgi:photosystem II stability/assembly factor-like uncharacterized protein
VCSSDLRSWIEDHLAKSPSVNGITFINNTTGWMVGDQGAVLLSGDAGAKWIPRDEKLLADLKVDWRAVSLFDLPSQSMVFGGVSNGSARIVFGSLASLTPASVPASARGIRSVAIAPNKVGIAVGDGGTILRSADGAKTWQLITPPAGASTTTLRAVVANPGATTNFVIAGNGGLILRSVDGGLNWTSQSSSTTEDLYALTRTGATIFAAGDNGVVRRAANSTGLNWVAESTGATKHFRGLAAFGEEVWAVSADGGIFHRRTTPIGGPLSVVNASDLTVEGAVGERVISEVLVANEGTKPLTAKVTADSATFVVTPSASTEIPPGEQARFVVQSEIPKSGNDETTIRVETTDDGGKKNELPVSLAAGKGDFTPLGYALLPGSVNLGTVVIGSKTQVDIPLSNLGQTNLSIQDLSVRTLDPTAVFQVGLKEPSPLRPKDSRAISLEFTPRTPGVFRGQLEVLSDGRNGLATVEITAEVVSRPEVVTIDAVPRGTVVLVNGNSTVTPVAFTFTTGTPGAGQLKRGDKVELTANATNSVDGVPYEFQQWDPGRGAKVTFIAGASVPKFTARYAPGLNAGASPSEPPLITASPCSFTPPTDVSFGPWVKISQARLTLPWLGDGSRGSDFKVEGALFLSSTRAYGSLTSSRVRVLVPTNVTAFASSLRGAEILEVTPGSWNLDVQSGLFRLGALSPGLQVLNASALPPGNLQIEVDVRAASANRHAFARFSTLDDLPLAPGLLVLGPGSASLDIGLNPAQPHLSFALNGSLRALAKPDGSGWVVNRSYNFLFDPKLPAIAPITFSTRTQLADLGLLRLFAPSGATIGPSFNGSTFSVGANNLELDFFRSGEFMGTSASVESDGTFSLDATLPVNGLGAGMVQLVPQSTSQRTASVVINPLQGALSVKFPGLFVNSKASLWEENRVELKPFTFDSEDFSIRVPLPGISFAKFEMERTGLDEDNYFEFTRSPDETKVKLRNRQDLFLGALKLGFTASSSGSLTGSLSGRLGLEGPSPLDAVSDRVSIDFRSSPAPEFVLNRHFFGIGARLQLGTNLKAGGRACLLEFGSSKPLREQAETLCLP